MTMYYNSLNNNAGYGHINCNEIPSSCVKGNSDIIPIIKNVLKNETLYFKCHYKYNGCEYCKHAYPLVKYNEQHYDDCYVRFDVTINDNTDTTKQIVIGATANNDYNSNGSLPCASWTKQTTTVKWEIKSTYDAATKYTNINTTVTNNMNGATVTLRERAIHDSDTSVPQIVDTVRQGLRDDTFIKVEEQIDTIVNSELNGIWPITTTSEVNTLLNTAYDDGDFDFYICDANNTTKTKSGSITVEYYVNSGTRQLFYSAGAKATKDNTVKLYVNKSISNKSNYSSNFFGLPEYSLKGTTFRIYTSSTGGSAITDINGNTAILTISNATGCPSNTVTLSASYAGRTVYLEETLPATSVGIKKPTSRYKVVLPAAGKSHAEPITNEPMADPVFLTLKKISPLTNGEPIADIDYNDIKYTLSYFGDNRTNAYSNSGAKDTWVFETKERNNIGIINFADESYKVSGDALYKVNGFVRYPIGWYRIQENQDQTTYLHNKGLEVSSDIYYVHIIDDNATSTSFEIFKGNTPYDSPTGSLIKEEREGAVYEGEHWETFSFTKKDAFLTGTGPTGDATFAGIQFKLYCESDVFNGSTTYEGHTYSINNNKEVVIDGKSVTLTSNASGKVTCSYKLPKEDTNGRRFYVVETSVPSSCGYQTPNATKYYINWNNANPTITNTTVENTPRMGKIVIHKRDDDSKDHMAQGDASLAGIKFAIVNRSEHPVHVDGDANDIAKGAVVKIVTTNENGEASAEKLPYGTYDIYELSEDSTLTVGSTYTAAATGSSIYANKSYLVSNNKFIGEAVIHPTDDSNTSVTRPVTANNSVVRADLRVKKVDTEMTDVQGDASLAGIQYAIVNSSKKSVKVNGITYNVGDVIYLIETIVIMHKFANAFLLNCLNFIYDYKKLFTDFFV